MTNITQLNKTFRRPKKKHKIKHKILHCRPQRKYTCQKLIKVTPRKPNSALRRVAWGSVRMLKKIRIRNINLRRESRKFFFVYIPGEGDNPLKPHSKILVQGGGPKDLPGLKYRAIVGKEDLPRHEYRRAKRSKYGAKKPEDEKNLIAKKPNKPPLFKQYH